MNRVVAILLSALFCATLIVAEALYAFRPGGSGMRSGGPSMRSPSMGTPSMRSPSMGTPSMRSHSSPSMKSYSGSNFTGSKTTSGSKSLTGTGGAGKTVKGTGNASKNVKGTGSAGKTAKAMGTSGKSFAATGARVKAIKGTEISKQGITGGKFSASATGLKKAGSLGGKPVFKGNHPLGPGGKALVAKRHPPRLGPHGHRWHGKRHWGWFHGRWWPYFALIGGAWWWYNQGTWIIVDDGPEALYIESEPIVLSQGETVVEPLQGTAEAPVSEVSEAEEAADPVIPICCVNRQCKATRDEESCIQQGGYMANSCPDCIK